MYLFYDYLALIFFRVGHNAFTTMTFTVLREGSVVRGIRTMKEIQRPTDDLDLSHEVPLYRSVKLTINNLLLCVVVDGCIKRGERL